MAPQTITSIPTGAALGADIVGFDIHNTTDDDIACIRQTLFLGRRYKAYIDGLPVDESEALLDALWAHTTGDPAYVWTQEWQAGDMIVWDNRCVMHRRNPIDDHETRLMHRTVLKGDAPY